MLSSLWALAATVSAYALPLPHQPRPAVVAPASGATSRLPQLCGRTLLTPTAVLPDEQVTGSIEAGPFIQGGSLSVAGNLELGLRMTLVSAKFIDPLAVDGSVKVRFYRAESLRLAVRAGYFFAREYQTDPGQSAAYAGVVGTFCFAPECKDSLTLGAAFGYVSEQPDSGPHSYFAPAPSLALLLTPFVHEPWVLQVMAEVQRLPVGEDIGFDWLGGAGARVARRHLHVDLGLLGYLRPHRSRSDLLPIPYLQFGFRI